MMLVRPEVHISFELHNSQNLANRNVLLDAIKKAIEVGELIPLENRMVRFGDTKRLARPVVKEIDLWFKNNYQINVKANPQVPIIMAREIFGARLRTTIEKKWDTQETIWDAIEVGVSAGINDPDNNLLAFSTTLFGKSIAMPVEGSHIDKINDVLDLFLRLAPPIIEVVQPSYAALTDMHQLELYGEKVMEGKLKYIYWCNYFGPIYLEKYGTKFLKNAPGFKIQPIGDGIWYQVTEKLDEFRDENLRKQVAEYFADIDGLRLA